MSPPLYIRLGRANLLHGARLRFQLSKNSLTGEEGFKYIDNIKLFVEETLTNSLICDILSKASSFTIDMVVTLSDYNKQLISSLRL